MGRPADWNWRLLAATVLGVAAVAAAGVLAADAAGPWSAVPPVAAGLLLAAAILGRFGD
jgi:hypothetical protein